MPVWVIDVILLAVTSGNNALRLVAMLAEVSAMVTAAILLFAAYEVKAAVTVTLAILSIFPVNLIIYF